MPVRVLLTGGRGGGRRHSGSLHAQPSVVLSLLLLLLLALLLAESSALALEDPEWPEDAEAATLLVGTAAQSSTHGMPLEGISRSRVVTVGCGLSDRTPATGALKHRAMRPRSTSQHRISPPAVHAKRIRELADQARCRIARCPGSAEGRVSVLTTVRMAATSQMMTCTNGTINHAT